MIFNKGEKFTRKRNYLAAILFCMCSWGKGGGGGGRGSNSSYDCNCRFLAMINYHFINSLTASGFRLQKLRKCLKRTTPPHTNCPPLPPILSHTCLLTISTGKLLLSWFYLMDHNYSSLIYLCLIQALPVNIHVEV